MTTPASLYLTNNSDITDLTFEIYVNNKQLYSKKILTGKTLVNFELPEDDGNYTLELVLKDKQHCHTTIDENGNIINDVLIKVTDVTVDGVNIDQILFNQADYLHDFNGNGPETIESYLGVLGCNGQVKLPFTCPVYVWILENI